MLKGGGWGTSRVDVPLLGEVCADVAVDDVSRGLLDLCTRGVSAAVHEQEYGRCARFGSLGVVNVHLHIR